jgi:alkaline phosphatase D
MRTQVEAKGLKPFTTYNYQFTVCNSNNASPVGRTKTAPSAHDHLDELKLAVFSCSNYREFFSLQRATPNSLR